jgi:hypothetical protein
VSKDQSRQRVKTLTKTALVSVSYLAFAAVTANDLRAQELPQAQQAVPSDESPSPPGTPAQQAPATQPGASPTPPATPAQQQPNTTPLPQVTVDAPRPRPHTTSTVRTSQLGATSSAPRTRHPPARKIRARRFRRPGRPAGRKMPARARSVSTRTARRWRPRAIRRWSIFRGRSAS